MDCTCSFVDCNGIRIFILHVHLCLYILVTKGKETDLQPMKGSSLTDISDSGKPLKLMQFSLALLNTKVPFKRGEREKGPRSTHLGPYQKFFFSFRK